MNILFLGDIVGRSGRDAVMKQVPLLREQHALDFVIVSPDNASGGFGVSAKDARELLTVADVLTCGDHVWDQKDLPPLLSSERRILRPANFPDSAPGSGCGIFTTASGKKIFILHLLGQVFHKEHAACPFATADALLKQVSMPGSVHAIFVDMHCEATSEKMAMGHYLDGRASAVIGSHTHVPTHDARVLPGGTAYQTDAGMCGDYNSVIGFEYEGPMKRFLSKIPKSKMEPATGEATVCGAIVRVGASGKAEGITQLRIGGSLC